MRFIGLQPSGELIRTLTSECLKECGEVLAAVPYAERGDPDVLLFDEALRSGKSIKFYGRSDGTCPIAPEVLAWFIRNEVRGARCRLVRHFLHAKVIWWTGQGVYIGSANLTDRAWNQNYEAGVFLTEDELDTDGMNLKLRAFFDQLEEDSFPLTQEEWQRQVDLEKRRRELMLKLYQVQTTFEKDHPNLKNHSSPITHQPPRTSLARRKTEFVNEWNETLQLIRSVGARVASDAYRPDWLTPDVPAGVQGDQFLHAFYYQEVDPRSEKDAYLREHEKNVRNPDAALTRAMEWWRSGRYTHAHEEKTVYHQAPRFRENFSDTQILKLTEDEWAETLGGSYAFGDHTVKMPNALLGLGDAPGSGAKIEAHARILYKSRSMSGRFSVPEVFRYVLWGSGEAAERVFESVNNPDYRIAHVGANILGEVIGWVRPTDYPPRNTRTNKALIALGYKVKAFV